MSLISKFKGGQNRLLTSRYGGGVDGVGLLGYAVDKGERALTSFGLGYAKAKYRERFAYRGVAGDTIVAVVGLLAGAALNVATGGRSSLAPHLERIGDAGLSAHFLQMGAELGADHAGYQTKTVSANTPKQLQQQRVNGDVVGAIPAAKNGTVFLSDQDILSALNKRA